MDARRRARPSARPPPAWRVAQEAEETSAPTEPAQPPAEASQPVDDRSAAPLRPLDDDEADHRSASPLRPLDDDDDDDDVDLSMYDVAADPEAEDSDPLGLADAAPSSADSHAAERERRDRERERAAASRDSRWVDHDAPPHDAPPHEPIDGISAEERATLALCSALLRGEPPPPKRPRAGAGPAAAPKLGTLEDTENKGRKLLKALGWAPGEALGSGGGCSALPASDLLDAQWGRRGLGHGTRRAPAAEARGRRVALGSTAWRAGGVEHGSEGPSLREWLTRVATSDAILPGCVLFAAHAGLKRGLLALGINFPASVVGMLASFALLLAVRAASPAAADGIETFCDPACKLFKVWLPVWLAPGFITLPLKMPPLGAAEACIFFAFLVCGLATSIVGNVAIARSLAPAGCAEDPDAEECAVTSAPPSDISSVPSISTSAGRAAKSAAAKSPFPRAQQQALGVGAVTLGALYVLGGASSALALNVALLCGTLCSFSLAQTLCPPKLQLYIHPFVTCSLATLGGCGALGSLSGLGWRNVLESYAGGAGSWLTMLLGPTVLSFAFQLYRFRIQLAERFTQVIGTAIGGSLLSMLTGAAAARLAGLSAPLRLALTSRTTTTALAGDVATIMGAPTALGMLGAFITGLLVIPLGPPLLTKCGVIDPPTRGLSLSGAAHGGAVLALGDEPEAFPFAALLMCLGAAVNVALVSVRPVRRLIVAVALGGAVA